MNIKYGLWTVINNDKIRINNRIYLSCKCECGTIRNVIVKNLKSGVSKSCGCVGRKDLINRSTKHNKRHTKVWRAWQSMKNRCSNKKLTQYYRYGGRGIKVCSEWESSFASFYKYIGDPPEGSSLDRVNNDGNYEPGNVKWSTPEEQVRNRSTNKKINGICITDISRSLGGGHGLVSKRLKRGWDIDKAVNTKSNAIV